jgi:hypothetical protein
MTTPAQMVMVTSAQGDVGSDVVGVRTYVGDVLPGVHGYRVALVGHGEERDLTATVLHGGVVRILRAVIWDTSGRALFWQDVESQEFVDASGSGATPPRGR